jgi:uncharacterized protein YeeX (DUF496 family)
MIVNTNVLKTNFKNYLEIKVDIFDDINSIIKVLKKKYPDKIEALTIRK